MLTLAAVVPLVEWHEQPELWLYFPAEFPSVSGTTESRSKLTNKMGRRTDCMGFGSSQCMRVLWYGDWTRSGLNEVSKIVQHGLALREAVSNLKGNFTPNAIHFTE